MNVLLYYPDWGNRWIPYIEKELSKYNLMVFNSPANSQINLEDLAAASKDADLLISMWCDGVTAFWADRFSDKKIISYLRRYEMWEDVILKNVKFENIDAMIFVSEYYRNKFPKEGLITTKYLWDLQFKLLNIYCKIVGDIVPPFLLEE